MLSEMACRRMRSQAKMACWNIQTVHKKMDFNAVLQVKRQNFSPHRGNYYIIKLICIAKPRDLELLCFVVCLVNFYIVLAWRFSKLACEKYGQEAIWLVELKWKKTLVTCDIFCFDLYFCKPNPSYGLKIFPLAYK